MDWQVKNWLTSLSQKPLHTIYKKQKQRLWSLSLFSTYKNPKQACYKFSLSWYSFVTFSEKNFAEINHIAHFNSLEKDCPCYTFFSDKTKSFLSLYEWVHPRRFPCVSKISPFWYVNEKRNVHQLSFCELVLFDFSIF